jgi:subtilisin family serine protease
MKQIFCMVGVVGIVALVAVPSAQAQNPGDHVPDHYILELRAGANAHGVAARHGLQPSFVYEKAVNGFAGFIPPGLLRRLQNDPDVAGVTPDRIMMAIAKPSRPGGGGSSSQVVPAGVQRIGAAPNSVTQTGRDVGVAVVDTGIDLLHADLTVGSSWFTAFGSSAQDDHGHGTHVAGTVAAKNNTVGVVGVAPQATVYAVKVLNNLGSGTDSTIIAGLNWVVTHGENLTPPIRVVNMSLGRAGSLDDNPALHAAVQSVVNAGISVVVAAGNNPNLEVSQQVPATYPEVMAIASTTALKGKAAKFRTPIQADTASYFTTDGAWNANTGIGVTVSAPGETQEDVSNGGFITSIGILSTARGGGTTSMYGTSMASPHAAGVVALLVQQAGGALAPETARHKLMAGATRINEAPLNSPTSTYTFDQDREGILSAPGALAAE